MVNSKTLRFPLVSLIVNGLFSSALVIVFVFSLISEAPLAMKSISGVVTIWAVYNVVNLAYSVKISEEDLSVWDFFRRTDLSWSEIEQIIPKKRDSLLLILRAGQQVNLKPHISDYSDLISTLYLKRPDLFKFDTLDSFHISLRWLLLFGSLAMATLFLANRELILGDPSTYLKSGLLIASALVMIILTLLSTTTIKLKNSKLIKITLLRSEEIQARDIADIRLNEFYASGNKLFSILIELKSGKNVGIASLREGMVFSFFALKEWWQKNKE